MGFFRRRSTAERLAAEQVRLQRRANRFALCALLVTAVGLAAGYANREDADQEGTVLVDVSADRIGNHRTWLIPRSASFDEYPNRNSGYPGDHSPLCGSFNSAPDDPDILAWFESVGAIDTSFSVYVNLQAQSKTEVRINRVEVISSSRSFNRDDYLSVVPCDLQAGGPDEIDAIQFDLSNLSRPAILYSEKIPGGAAPLSNYSLTVPADGGYTFTLYALASAQEPTGKCTAYEWRVRLHAIVDGRRRIIDVDRDGAPFTTATNSTPIESEILNPSGTDLLMHAQSGSNLVC